eukprot:scaffold23058_cov68-Phaeocystis_antarctica.AAC.7
MFSRASGKARGRSASVATLSAAPVAEPAALREVLACEAAAGGANAARHAVVPLEPAQRGQHVVLGGAPQRHVVDVR